MSSAAERIAALKAKFTGSHQPVVVNPVKLELPKENPIIQSMNLTVTAITPPENIGPKSIYAVSANDANEKQKEAMQLARMGKSFCLIGSAGTGKTTTTKIIINWFYENGLLPEIQSSTKNLIAGSPSILICSFTNQAVGNIRRLLPPEFKRNGLTIHKVLEYSPVWYEYEDENGNTKKTMRYEPLRNSINKLPFIKICIIEEAGSVSVELFEQLQSALPEGTIFIFLGDLQQIPPVFGDAILGYKLLELPVVELTHIYRQASDSNIKKFAYKILEGSPITDKQIQTFHKEGEMEFIKFQSKPTLDTAIKQAGGHFQNLVEKGEFNPEEDVLLIPYNVKLGIIEMNKYIAQKVSDMNNATVYEILAGRQQEFYLAPGDMVYYNKIKYKILSIESNPNYLGKLPQKESKSLNRWGYNKDKTSTEVALEKSRDEMTRVFDLEAMDAKAEGDEGSTHQASHKVTLQRYIAPEDREDEGEVGETISISQAGDFSKLIHSYACTVHRAQGSEWKRVFIIFHESHSKMLKREILYTAHTRAREFLRVYYSGEEPGKSSASVYQKGILNQYIPGTTLAEKLRVFRKKMEEQPEYIKRKKPSAEETMDNIQAAIDARKSLKEKLARVKSLNA